MGIQRKLLVVLCLLPVLVLDGASLAHAQRRARKQAIVARSALVLDASDGRTLYAKNPDQRMYPASTTKVLTAIIAIESGRLDETVTVRHTDLKVVPTVIGLVAGERIALRDLVYALLLRSGNDAARAIARHISGSQATFAKEMTFRARELGCTGSNFTNAHGLPNRYHYTTAHDLGRIMRYAMSNPTFRAMTGTSEYRSRSSHRTRVFRNKNKLLRMYEGTTGGKPGYTRAAQQTLVAAAKRRGREVVIVCLHSYGKALWSDAMRLFDLGFSRTQMSQSPRGRQPTLAASSTSRDE